MNGLLPLLGADSLRWDALPPPWVLALVVVPAGLALVVLAYRTEAVSPAKRSVLAGLRLATVLAAALLLFGPYIERTILKKVRSHVVVLIDASASMEVSDEPDPATAAALARATDTAADSLGTTSRLDLARRALLRGGADAPLERLRERFAIHVYSFTRELRTVWSDDEERDAAPGAEPRVTGLRDAVGAVKADGSSTRIGDAVLAAAEDFRLRDEPLAGIVVVSDGRQTSGTRTPREAGEAARAFVQRGSGGARGVPVVALLAGDPSSSRNVQVRNLVAPEVVLARDDATFEFDVVQKGFDGQSGVLRLMFVDPAGENATLVPGEVSLVPGDAGVRVQARHRFDVPGTFRVRVGVPPLSGERVAEDNWLDHQVRVVDRKVKVLYVDGRPRREWESLQRALTRDADTMLVHTLQMESARDVPQPRTEAPGWGPLPGRRFPATRSALFDYDVVVLGDVAWTSLGDTTDEATERLKDLRDFVEAGGGLLVLAGEFHMPLDYRRTPIAELLPVVVDADEVSRTRGRDSESFNLALTAEGRESPILRVHDDARRSRALWEETQPWKQWWYFPARRLASGARALAVHPKGVEEARGGESGLHGNRYGPHVLVAARTFGLGRVLWVGVEEMWRMRYGVGDRFYYAFYARAVRYLASYRLLGGNKRVKIHPERQVYYLDEPVGITAHVVGEDFRPPSPVDKPKVTAVLTLPDRTERPLELLPIPRPEGEEPTGVYRATFAASVAGTWSVAPDPSEVPGEEPESKAFAVQSSAEEQKDPSVDAESLRAMAAASGGVMLSLTEADRLADPELLRSRDFRIPVESRPDAISDEWWVPVLLTLLLAAEWLLRKRWRLL